jgi:dTDP-glucose 4,6-dehydratase
LKLLVTGAAGFIGSNFVHYLLREHPDYNVVALDKLAYAGNLRNLETALGHPRFRFVRQDICDPGVVDAVQGCDAIVHLAAETHVDRSIDDATSFVRTNVEGTWRLMECARAAHVPRFVHASTDEVYGSLDAQEVKSTESSPLNPTSPYAASKAAADLLALSYVRTHGFPAIITRCSNTYGPYQFPEKFIPLMIAQALAGEPLPVYGDGQNVRDWIDVSDNCRALDLVLHGGREGEVYNVGGDCERRNLDVARQILRLLERPEELVQFVADRPAHDRRYAVDSRKIREELNWRCETNFDAGLAATVHWYRTNQRWLDETRSGEYRAYFEKQYLHRDQTLRAGQRG